MKKNIVSILLAVAVVVLFVLHFVQSTTGTIGYVDTNLLLQKYEAMKDAHAQYEKKEKVWQAQTDTLMQEWEVLLKSYEKESNRMTAQARQQKTEELRYKQQQISNYKQAIEKKSHEEQEKLTKGVVSTANEFIMEYGKKHHYKIILGANGSGSLLYAEKKIDITELILEGLNKEYKGK
jgi:Outer membrane protein